MYNGQSQTEKGVQEQEEALTAGIEGGRMEYGGKQSSDLSLKEQIEEDRSNSGGKAFEAEGTG